MINDMLPSVTLVIKLAATNTVKIKIEDFILSFGTTHVATLSCTVAAAECCVPVLLCMA